MAKKSSNSSKGKAPASKGAAAATTARGASGSHHAPAFSPPLHGGSSSSGSTPHSAAVFASPPPLLHIPSFGASSSSCLTATGSPVFLVPPRAAVGDARMRSIEKHILDLRHPDRRENALEALSKKREAFHDLAPLLWYSFGTITILLQEVLSIYPPSSPASLTLEQSNRVCNVIALLQLMWWACTYILGFNFYLVLRYLIPSLPPFTPPCFRKLIHCVASHPETRILFVKARIPCYLYWFLDKIGESRPFEHLRLATLGVIGALVKVPHTMVITFLLSSEVMPVCLRAMQSGTETLRTVATFIVQRILQDDVGLSYVCHLPERLFVVCQALGNVVASLADKPSIRLLKHIIKCYVRLLDDQKSLWVLRNSFPKRLSDGTFDQCLREDQAARIWLQELLDNVGGPHITQEGGVINMPTWVLSIVMRLRFQQIRHYLSTPA